MKTHDVRDVKRLYLSGTYFCEGVGKETEELRRKCHQERIL